MEMQIPAGPRYGSREKSGLVCQGEVRHECTKQALARLRPGGTGHPGRGYRRSRVARAEHLDLAEKPPGLVLHQPAAMLRCPFAVITTRHEATSCDGCFDGRRLFKLNICFLSEFRPQPALPLPVHRNAVPPRFQPRPPSP